MKTTANYGLKKPEATDFYDVNDFNGNMDIIDGKIKEIEENGGGIKDGIIDENFVYVGGGAGGIYADEDATKIEHHSNPEDSDGDCTQVVINKTEVSKENLVEIVVRKDGEEVVYKLYGEHNPPPVIDNLLSTLADVALSANQGRVLNEKKLEGSDVVDNLLGTASDLPLSARQGKILKDSMGTQIICVLSGDTLTITSK